MQCRYRWLMLVTLLGFMPACKDNPEETKLTYMPDMMDAPTVKPQKDYLDPPEGSVAMEAMIYPKTAEEAETSLRNPFSEQGGDDFHLAQGKKLFDTFCAVCHGPNAKGEGTIIDKFPKPPDLTADLYKNKQDGFFFHRITFGSVSKIMPGYGHAISIRERWQIVLYLRLLQNNR